MFGRDRLVYRTLQCTSCVVLTTMIAMSAQAGLAASAGASATVHDLNRGWHVTQDVRQLGEKQGWYKPEFSVDWQPIERLAHLQLLLAKQPYFGRELRYFNESPWWYRLELSAPSDPRQAMLRFEGVDYFAKVWLNGVLLGEHEGYAEPFEFEVGKILRREGKNVLVIKVSSPWDHKYRDESERDRTTAFFSVERNLLKGSYEHADTFVQRDVNPVGIWRPVSLIFHDVIRAVNPPAVTTDLAADKLTAKIGVAWQINLDGPPRAASFRVHVRKRGADHDEVFVTQSIRLQSGMNTLNAKTSIQSPALWTTWDRGSQPLYEARVELAELRVAVAVRDSVIFGVRSVELRRTAEETRFFINGQPIYLRGAAYWPDLYLSNMSRERYERDIQAAIRAGFNAFRVHVHTENPEFYEICDRLGMVILQDNDLNWVFPQSSDFSSRAVEHFRELVGRLKNHPSIIAWIAMNEVGFSPDFKVGFRSPAEKLLGACLVAEANREDPSRPVIENSMEENDLASGDAHDYRGSLWGGSYFELFGVREKLVTEFGVDAPPSSNDLSAVPEAARRLREVMPRVAELHDYQYHLLKYFVEHFRIQKYSPNAGYFQFMWIDFSPQSFYGMYDYWGHAKVEGLGGGLRAMLESNQPIGIFMEHDAAPHALYAVNDSSSDLGDCVAHWRVSSNDAVISEGSKTISLGPDSHGKIIDLNLVVREGEHYTIALDLKSWNGKVLAKNSYLDPFAAQRIPQGFPERIDDELGMRLWWAGDH